MRANRSNPLGNFYVSRILCCVGRFVSLSSHKVKKHNLSFFNVETPKTHPPTSTIITMKSFFILTALLGLLSLAESFDEDKKTCTDKLNEDPLFKEKCIELFCRCMDDCSPKKVEKKVDADGKVTTKDNNDYSVEDCFRNNKCSIKDEMDKLIDCTTCIMERPPETYDCEDWRTSGRPEKLVKRIAEQKKRAEAEKKAEEEERKLKAEAAEKKKLEEKAARELAEEEKMNMN